MDKNNPSTEPAKISSPHKSMNTWKHMVAHSCILFLVIALFMVYFTSTGSPQAGLLEVGASAFIFVVLFHFVMKFFPLISKIITSVIVIGFGMALIFVNYHYLRAVKTDAPLKQLLVGDLLVKKILKTINKEPIAVATNEGTPKTVSDSSNEKPSPAMSPVQPKTTLAEPVMSVAGVEPIPATPLAPAIKKGTTSVVAKNNKPELSGSVTAEEVSRLAFTTKIREPIVQQTTGRKDSMPLSMQGVIQETSTITLQCRPVLPPVSGATEPIHVLKLCKPFIEGRVPIN